jgi:hypothetical protein
MEGTMENRISTIEKKIREQVKVYIELKAKMDELLNMINKLYPSEITCVVVNEKEERPPPLSDSTFLTILSMADSLVNVHVKDGSIYSGLFHTTYVQGQFSTHFFLSLNLIYFICCLLYINMFLPFVGEFWRYNYNYFFYLILLMWQVKRFMFYLLYCIVCVYRCCFETSNDHQKGEEQPQQCWKRGLGRSTRDSIK